MTGEATAVKLLYDTLRSPQGLSGYMGRALNLIDPVGSTSVASASVTQIRSVQRRMFGSGIN